VDGLTSSSTATATAIITHINKNMVHHSQMTATAHSCHQEETQAGHPHFSSYLTCVLPHL
jgi:hypothetical protein